MKIAVVGSGYVGLVTGACLANLGNNVICVDKDKKRIATLKKGKVPFYEPGLFELVAKNIKANRLFFTCDLSSAVFESDIIFIAVGTPLKKNGEADISAVKTVVGGIARAIKEGKIKDFKIIVNKSTVPVGMGDIVTKILLEKNVAENLFSVISNPEFLREGSAISDFMNPDRIVVGASNNKASNVITELYRPINAHIIFTSVKSAELIKYASNSFLATKISFINEIANICERVGSDVLEVANGMGLDKRIGERFLNAGLGYGGSCFPKDVSALTCLAKKLGYFSRILTATSEVNGKQIKTFITKIIKRLGSLRGKKIAVLGLSFKPETDDLRDASALKVISALKKRGARVLSYDPVSKLSEFSNVYSAIKGVDAIVIATEWAEFRELDFDRVKKLAKKAIIFDGRNIYDKRRLAELGIEYYGVGR